MIYNVSYVLKACLISMLALILIVACNGKTSPPITTRTDSSSPPVTRTVKHDMGETQVPINPKRVVTTGTFHLANTLALGIQPIACVAVHRIEQEHGLDILEPYMRGRSQELIILGYNSTGDRVNLEALLKLNPDLIITGPDNRDIYNQLSQIAPTTFHQYKDWKSYFQSVSEALGKREEAEKLLEAYHQRTQEFKNKIGTPAANIQVSVINPNNEGILLLSKDSFAADILRDAGLSRPSSQEDANASVPVSFEWIPQMDGDVIFLVSLNNTPDRIRGLRCRRNKGLGSWDGI